MTKYRLHILWMTFFLSGFQFAYSQAPVSVSDSVDRRSILIGEPIQLTLRADVPTGTNATWFLTDSLAHFEFIEKGKIDSEITVEGKIFRQHLVITSFDSGRWEIPPLAVAIDTKKFYTDSITINVDFSKFDPRQDYHDIKDIIEVENPFVRFISWVLSAITFISLLLFVYFLTRRKSIREEVQMLTPRFSPLEEALKALDALQRKRLAENGEVKTFYMELNEIIRVFVLRKMQIASMERTNEELILQFRGLNLSKEQFSRLAQALRIIDFVKFAKYLPGPNEHQENFEIIKSSIEVLNTLEK